MPKPHRFLEGAKAELEEAADRFGRESAARRVKFVAAVDHAIMRITDAPERWRKHRRGSRRLVMVNYPFSIIYYNEPDEVVIAAVAHHSRRPGYWTKRLR